MKPGMRIAFYMKHEDMKGGKALYRAWISEVPTYAYKVPKLHMGDGDYYLIKCDDNDWYYCTLKPNAPLFNYEDTNGKIPIDSATAEYAKSLSPHMVFEVDDVEPEGYFEILHVFPEHWVPQEPEVKTSKFELGGRVIHESHVWEVTEIHKVLTSGKSGLKRSRVTGSYWRCLGMVGELKGYYQERTRKLGARLHFAKHVDDGRYF